jgi:hypothetical protein
MTLIIIAAVLLATFIGWATASIAGGKGRDPAAWFLVGFFLGVVPLVVACFMENLRATASDAR